MANLEYHLKQLLASGSVLVWAECVEDDGRQYEHRYHLSSGGRHWSAESLAKVFERSTEIPTKPPATRRCPRCRKSRSLLTGYYRRVVHGIVCLTNLCRQCESNRVNRLQQQRRQQRKQSAA